ncbi:MAG: hypothetical protein ACLQU5_15100 [Isosphaeraceae bacterium]
MGTDHANGIRFLRAAAVTRAAKVACRRGQWIISAAIVVLALLTPTTASAQFKQYLGNYTNGYYGNQDDRIVMFCIVVGGEFSKQNVMNAISTQIAPAITTMKQSGVVNTLNTSQNITFHTFINDTCLVYGWVDIDKGSGGWLAMTNTNQATSRVMKDDRPDSWPSNGWQKDVWSFEGWRIFIQGAADGQGNIVMGASVQS